MAAFYLQQFVIEQDHCAMKVGTDAMLLGSWLPAVTGRALDVGTGTGILALMLAQRSPDLHIDAIEIDVQAARQAQANIQSSPWFERIQVFAQPMQAWVEQSSGPYQLIFSNPPYFDEAIKPPKNQRCQARHSDSLKHSELLQLSLRMLAPEGQLALILPTRFARSFAEAAQAQGLSLLHEAQVSHRPQDLPHRHLMLWSKQQHKTETRTFALHSADGKTYSSQYKKMTAAYFKVPPPGFVRKKSACAFS